MKKVTILLTIAILVCMTGFLAYSKNNSSSYASFTVNSTYGSHYNPPAITDKSCTGSDYEGPLWSTADTWVGYTDDGGPWNRLKPWPYYITKAPYNPRNGTPSGFRPGNVRYRTLPAHPNLNMAPGHVEVFYEYKDYHKIFATSAYAYISCSSDNLRYKTEYDLYAEVPEGFHIEPIRDPDTQTEYGSFSDNEFRDGSVGGWDHELSTEPAANVSASGFNPSDKSTHSTEAEAPTTSTAHDLYIYCDFCNSSGCSICSDFR